MAFPKLGASVGGKTAALPGGSTVSAKAGKPGLPSNASAGPVHPHFRARKLSLAGKSAFPGAPQQAFSDPGSMAPQGAAFGPTGGAGGGDQGF